MIYEIWLEMSHVMAQVEAKDSAEARKIFNRRLNCRRVKDAVGGLDE